MCAVQLLRHLMHLFLPLLPCCFCLAAIITSQPTLTADGFDTMYQASARAGQTLINHQSNSSQPSVKH
jgi:hypothetical protein